MATNHLIRDDEHLVRQYEYDDRSVIAIDLGAAEDDASVDLVGTTVILVADGDQYEFEVPVDHAEDAHTFMKNGVLTIEMEDAA